MSSAPRYMPTDQIASEAGVQVVGRKRSDSDVFDRVLAWIHRLLNRLETDTARLAPQTSGGRPRRVRDRVPI